MLWMSMLDILMNRFHGLVHSRRHFWTYKIALRRIEYPWLLGDIICPCKVGATYLWKVLLLACFLTCDATSETPNFCFSEGNVLVQSFWLFMSNLLLLDETFVLIIVNELLKIRVDLRWWNTMIVIAHEYNGREKVVHRYLLWYLMARRFIGVLLLYP